MPNVHRVGNAWDAFPVFTGLGFALGVRNVIVIRLLPLMGGMEGRIGTVFRSLSEGQPIMMIRAFHRAIAGKFGLFGVVRPRPAVARNARKTQNLAKSGGCL
jgi:hypothetical protein